MADSQEPTSAQISRANKSVGGSLILSSVRCTLQYVVLPFVLLPLGFGSTVSTVVTLMLSGIAVALILYNVIELWSTSWRWRYLGLAVVLLQNAGQPEDESGKNQPPNPRGGRDTHRPPR